MPSCKSCGRPIVWMKTRNGKFIPIEPTSVNYSRTDRDDDGVLLYESHAGHRVHLNECPAREHPPAASPYAELQLVDNAHPDVVKAAYRALALIYHPDRINGSLVKMQAINAAYAQIVGEWR